MPNSKILLTFKQKCDNIVGVLIIVVNTAHFETIRLLSTAFLPGVKRTILARFTPW